jgi:hypothetical protein
MSLIARCNHVFQELTMTDQIVILVILVVLVLSALLLLVLLVRREPHEVLRTLAQRITIVKLRNWLEMTFADPAERSEISVVSVAIATEASPKVIKGTKNSNPKRVATNAQG